MDAGSTTDVSNNRANRLFSSLSLVQGIILFLLFGLGFGIRIYDRKDPPLDFHPTRQLRSALIARSVYYQINPDVEPELRQKAADLADLEVYEPPILEQIVGFTYFLIGSEQLWIARVYNAFFWLIGGIAIFALGRRFASIDAVVLGLALYFFLPFSVIASRSFQPEPWMVMWIILAAYALFRWSEEPTWKWAVLSGMLGGMAVLVKVVAGFFVMSMMLAVLIATLDVKRFYRHLHSWVMAGLMAAPTISYYLLFHQQRSSDFLSFWVVSLSGLIMETNFYADWLAMIKGLMGLTTFVAAVLGVLIVAKQAKPVLIAAWIGYGLYGLVFPYQYVTHEYYHLALIPIAALSLMPFLDAFLVRLKKQSIFWRLLGIGVFLFASGYSLYVARSVLYAADFQYEPVSWQRVGEALPEDHPFIALTADYGMRLRYYGWRAVSATWPSSGDLRLSALRGSDPLEYEAYFEEFTAGKDYFLVTAFSELEAQPHLKVILESGYPVFAEGNGYLVYDLTSSQE